MATFGRLEEFNPRKETISSYLERIELYFLANEIAEKKQVAVFLSVIGGQMYSLLRNLLAPAKPHEQNLQKLLEALRKYYEPKRVVIAEQFTFHQRNQEVDESIADYVAELRKLTLNCDFKDHLDEALRDRFVCGLRSEAAQKQLLTESELTFTRAVEIAKGMEVADKKSRQFKGATDGVVNKLTGNPPPQPCFRCGKQNHKASSCYFKDATCNHCGKKGHNIISKVCRSASSKKPTQTSQKSNGIRLKQPNG